jgi:hypothetical protein
MRDRLMRKAQTVSAHVSVAMIETTELNINAALQQVIATVRLDADDESRRIATEWEALQAKLTLDRMNAQVELERLRHLREDIFQHPDVARTYWLDRHPDAVAAALSDDFERIAEKLGSGPGPATMTVANLLREFLTDLSSAEKVALVDLVRRMFVATGRADLADQLPEELE